MQLMKLIFGRSNLNKIRFLPHSCSHCSYVATNGPRALRSTSHGEAFFHAKPFLLTSQTFLSAPRSFFTVKQIRKLSGNQIATALRPFFFSVHPDLFGKFPHARAVNEESMKRLNAFLDILQQQQQQQLKHQQSPLNLTFYLRKRIADGFDPNIVKVSVQLKDGDVRTQLVKLLKACDISTEYVDSLLPPKSVSTFSSFTNLDRKYEKVVRSTPGGTIIEEEVPFFKRRPKKADDSLVTWLKANGDKAKMYQTEAKPIREEILKIKANLEEEFGFEDISWSAEWNRTQCLGSFRSLYRIVTETPDGSRYFSGKTIVFSARTGINIRGKILLSPKDVPQNWAKALQNYNTNDSIIYSHIPAMEALLSSLLNDIGIVHEKNQEEMLAEDYHRHLQKMVTMLRCHYAKGFPPPRDGYDDLQLVVEGDSAPLTLSPGGHFLTPSVAPASILLPFIAANQDEASRLLITHTFLRRQMEEEVARCQRLFSLEALTKDRSVQSEHMIECCRRLCASFHEIYIYLPVGSKVVVTSYFTVLQSGEICIPWNWKPKQEVDEREEHNF